MRGIRRPTASARPATQAATGRTAEHQRTVFKRLCRWATVFAFAEAALALPPIYFGVHLSAVLVIIVLPATALLFWFVNLRTATAVHGHAPPAIVPRARGWFALGMALVVTYAVVSWVFDAEIEQARTPAGNPARTAAIKHLEQEKEGLRGTLGLPVPAPDEDADVRHLQRRIDDATKEFGEAKRNELCELDGTCGTRTPGRGKAYFEKFAYTLQVKERLDALSADLPAAKATAESRFQLSVQAQGRAAVRIAEIDRRIEEPQPSSGEKRGWIPALFTVGEEQAFWMILVSLGTLGLSFAIDLFGFRLIARRVYRRTEKRTEVVDEVVEQIDIDHWHPNARPVADFLRGKDER
jgi:hypothetical protein